MRRLAGQPPFNEPTAREALFERIKDLPGLRLGDVGMRGFPAIPLAGLADEAQMSRLLAALDWMIAKLRATT